MTTIPEAQRPARPDRGDRIDVTVDRLAHGGAGVARTDSGYVVFVGGTVPGDRVRVELTKRKRNYGEGRLLEVLTPSPERIAPVAPHPGAPWQVLTYERQLEEKQAQVVDAMTRLGGFESPPVREIVPAVEQWRYRNKVEFSFAPVRIDDEQDDDGTGFGAVGSGTRVAPKAGEFACGFHPPGEWWRVVDVEDCMLASERVNNARRQVVDWARAQGLTAYDRKTEKGLLRNLVIREGRNTGQLQVRLIVSVGKFDYESLAEAVDCDGLLVTRTDSAAETSRGGDTMLVRGKDRLDEELCGIRYEISPEAFFQTNTEMADVLYGIVREAAALQGHERLLDLYCGIGTIGLTLAPRVSELWGIESIPEAIEDARDTARREGYADRSQFVVGDVRLALPALIEKGVKADIAVVDPPRAGLSQKVVRRIVDAGPKRLIYVSCNPTTLAPNAAQLVEAGYELKSVQPVDMFLQTPHIETVAVFERGPNGLKNPDRD